MCPQPSFHQKSAICLSCHWHWCGAKYHIAGNFKEKTFVNFEVLLLIAKVFSANFRGVASFSDTREHFTNFFFPRKISTNSQKCFPSYGTGLIHPNNVKVSLPTCCTHRCIYPQNWSGEPIINPGGKYFVRLNLNGTRRKVYIGMCIWCLPHVSLHKGVN